jgi:hypothetical protein
VPEPHGGVVGEPVEQPSKAGSLRARVVIVDGATHLPDEQYDS